MWIGLKRFKPRPDENYPIWMLVVCPLVMALAGVAFIQGLLLLGDLFFETPGASTGGMSRFASELLAVVGYTSGLAHWGFGSLSWNQRAARLRRGGIGVGEAKGEPGVMVRWLLGPLYLFVVCAVLPLVVLTGIENVRGALEWKRTREALQAKGERMSMKDLLLPSVPGEQNLATIPIFADLFDYSRDRTGNIQWKNTNALSRFRVFSLPDNLLPQRTNKGVAQSAPPPRLEDWAEAFRKATSKNEEDRRAKRRAYMPLPNYGEAPAGASAAAVVMAGLSVAEADLGLIREAAGRPYSRFPVHYEDGFGALLPHLAMIKSVARHLELRTQALVQAGRGDEAFGETLLGLRLVEAARDEALLISHLVRFAQTAIVTQQIWHGVEAHAWKPGQWEELQAALGKLEFLKAITYAIEGERAISIVVMERWAQNPRQFRDEVRELGLANDPMMPNGMVAAQASAMFIPRGWIRQNQATLSRHFQDTLDGLRELQAKPSQDGFLGTIGKVREVDETLKLRLPSDAYHLFVKTVSPAFLGAISKTARAIHHVRCAMVACALERYRLRQGKYPASLGALVPEYLTEAPKDVLTGGAMGYRQTSDGLFRVWSVGMDGEDNGGALRSKTGEGVGGEKEGIPEERGRDWVWPSLD